MLVLTLTRNTFFGTRYLSHCHAIAVAFQHYTPFTRSSKHQAIIKQTSSKAFKIHVHDVCS